MSDHTCKLGIICSECGERISYPSNTFLWESVRHQDPYDCIRYLKKLTSKTISMPAVTQEDLIADNG